MPRGKATGGPSQREMVKAALEDLGEDAKPGQLQEHIQQKFNRELPKGIISSYKSQLKAKPAGGTRRPGRPARVSVTSGYALNDIVTVQELIRRLGPTSLNGLIETLSK